MADAIGIDGMHNVTGLCELCGEECNSALEELNALTCTFAQCNARVYHQDCLEKFLKSIKCEKNRKTGFQCPRGRGKASCDEPCPGRIDKSHPIHPRSDGNKKKKKSKTIEPVQPPPRFGPAAKAARQKEKEEKDQQQKAALEAERDAARRAVALAASSKKNNNLLNDYQRNKLVAESLKRDLVRKSHAPDPTPPQPAEVKLTLEEYEALKSSSRSAAVRPVSHTVNAWSRPGAADKLQEKVSITPTAFPSMPSAPAPSRVRAKDAVRHLQSQPTSHSAWGSSQAMSEVSYEMDAPAPSLRHQPTPAPPPPPRSDISATSTQPLSVHNSMSAAARPQNMPARGTGAVRMSLASSFSSQLSTSSLQSSLPSADPLAGAPAAAASEGPDAEVRLTKAQKKNLKRAEKKARQAGGCGDAGGASARLAGLTHSPMLQACLEALAHFKTMCCLQCLLGMSFDHWQCIAAIQRVGPDVDRASDWICEHLDDARTWAGDVLTYDGPATYVNVSQEMAAVEEALALLPCSPAQLHIAVVDCGGNLYEALARLVRATAEAVSSRQHTPLQLNGGSCTHMYAHSLYDDVPQAALMAAAAVAHDADAAVQPSTNFDSLLATFV